MNMIWDMSVTPEQQSKFPPAEELRRALLLLAVPAGEPRLQFPFTKLPWNLNSMRTENSAVCRLSSPTSYHRAKFPLNHHF